MTATRKRHCLICGQLFEPRFDSSSEMTCAKLDCVLEMRKMQSKVKDLHKYVLKTCPQCGNDFFTYDKRKTYCSKICSHEKKLQDARRRAQLRKSPYDPTDGLTINDSKSDSTKSDGKLRCVNCGAVLKGKQLKYCKPSCKNAYMRSMRQAERKFAESQLLPKPTRLDRIKAAYKAQEAAANRGKPKPRPLTGEERKAAEKEARKRAFIERRSIEESKEMLEYHKRKAARAKWKKVPIEDAMAICKQYGLSYGEYQTLKYSGKLDEYIASHPVKEN